MSAEKRASLANLRRRVVLAVAIEMTVVAGIATAQTVIVRRAPVGSTVEFVLNTTPVGSATTNADGDATVTASGSANVAKPEMDAHVYVDVCENNVRRVLVAERGVRAAEQPGCDREQIPGLFLVRRVTTLVVDVSGENPTLLLRQGSFSLRPPRAWSPSPAGLVLFGGAGLARFSNVSNLACGDLQQCSGDASGIGYTAGAAYWFSKYVAAEGAYIRPAEASVSGSGTNFRFTSLLDAHIVTAAGLVGVPIGPVRLYGKVGSTYHRATFATNQTVDATTVTVDGVVRPVEGGTQTYELQTAGWGWLFGGGIEVWLARSFALYSEGGSGTVKGAARDDADGRLDDRLSYIALGARVRIGR